MAADTEEGGTTPSGESLGVSGVVHVEEFEPEQVRPWRFHNRAASGLDDASLEALSESIRRDGQQQHGLARRLPAGDTHLVEAIFGVRRLEACRRAGLTWRAEVQEESFSDARCAALMHSENEWTENVSALENAIQWKYMLDAGVFENQVSLASAIGFHPGTVSRAVRAASVLFGDEWIDRLVRPVMHDFSVRAANRLTEALLDADQGRARQEARAGPYAGNGAGQRAPQSPARPAHAATRDRLRAPRQIRHPRRRGGQDRTRRRRRLDRRGASARAVSRGHGGACRAGRGGAGDGDGPRERSPAGSPAGVHAQPPTTPRNANQAWLEGCVWAAAHASGLDWERWRCAGVAEALRSQRGGWERAVVHAVGGKRSDPSGPA